MAYSELLQKVIFGTECCNGEDLTTCYDCPYRIGYGVKVDSQSHKQACQQALLHDKSILINIMKHLDKLRYYDHFIFSGEVTNNG